MRYLSILFCCFLVAGNLNASDDTNSKELLSRLMDGDHFALLRHALAPGTGDPLNFDVNDCATQRNLDAIGVQQARDIGDTLRQVGIGEARVYSSQWCRCMDTAREMTLGPVTELPVLNSFFRHRENADAQTTGLKEWINRQPLQQAVILVTHQVNITALTGVYPSSGELVIIRRTPESTLEVIGTLDTLP